MSAYIRLNEDGILEQIDLHTGESRLILEKHEQGMVAEGGLVRVTTEDGSTAWVSRTISMEDMRKIAGGRKFFPYSTLLAEDICAKVAEGAELTTLAGRDGLPNYSTLCKWRRENPEFEAMYRQAKKDRAEFFFARARAEVEGAMSEDDVPVAKLRTDFYKYGAKVGDPGSFQEVQKVDARVAVGVSRLETGIRRVNDSGYESERIERIEKEFNLGRIGDGNRVRSEGIEVDSSNRDSGQVETVSELDAVVISGSVHDGGGASGD